MAGVKSAVHDLDRVKVTCDQEKAPSPLTAPDDAAAQKALDALAAHGFHGDTGNSTLKFKEDSGVTAGKVTSVTLRGFTTAAALATRPSRKRSRRSTASRATPRNPKRTR